MITANSNTVYNVTNFIMNVNSLYAISVENTWGTVCLKFKGYFLNFGEKNPFHFLLLLLLELK